MSDEELIILKNLDPKWTHLHRNMEGDLELRYVRKIEDNEITVHYDYFTMFNHIFQSVTLKKTIDLLKLKEVITQ